MNCSECVPLKTSNDVLSLNIFEEKKSFFVDFLRRANVYQTTITIAKCAKQ